MSINIVIADDHGILRAGLAALLNNEPDMTVVGEAEDGDQAVRLVLAKRPDIVLMDITMAVESGIDATSRILKTAPEIRVIMLTVHEDMAMLEHAVQNGARGYILKSAIKTDLINAIHTVMRGQLYIHPSMTIKFFEERSDGEGDTQEILQEELTQRECEVLRLIALGYTNTQAAEKLNISPRTIEYHRSNISSKLNSHSRVDLVKYAQKLKLI